MRSRNFAQAIQLTEEDLEPSSARADVSGKPGWMGPAPNSTGMRSQAGPPVPAGAEQSPAAARPEHSVGDSVNELPPAANSPGASLPRRPRAHMLVPADEQNSLSCHGR